MVFINAFAGILSLLLIVALGYLLARLNWFSASTIKLIPKLVTNVSLPPFLACTIITHFEADKLGVLLTSSLLPLLSMSLLFSLAYIAGKAIHVKKSRFGLFCACVSNPNTIFIGIPVNLALFGPEAVPCVLLYYFPSTFFFWTVGNYFISRDESPEQSKGSAFKWNKIVSPPMYGFTFGLVCVWLNIPLPDSLFLAAKLTGDLTTPLALIFIGITLQGMNLAKIRLSLDIGLALIGRMIASPLLLWALLPFFNLPELVGQVFVIQSSLPVLMQVAILSAYYNTDPDYGSIMVCLSTVLCVFTVPIYRALL